jgi:hypothetical protein
MLRHSSVAITEMHYADKRNRASVGLGHLLNESSIAESAAQKEVVS